MKIISVLLEDIYGWDKELYPEYYKSELLKIDLHTDALNDAQVEFTDGQMRGKEMLLLNESQFVSLSLAGIKFQKSFQQNIPDSISKPFEEVTRKHDSGNPQGEQSGYNERVHVHMPGQALSMYNRVMLLEDTCSDYLQTTLDEGWRIIAACPQPDQRRPDYILGRFEPNYEICSGTRAKRNN